MNRLFPTRLLMSTICMTLIHQPALTQEYPAVESAQPHTSLLNSDGTLNLSTGFSGSLDARGWQMVIGKNGEPRFVQSGKPAGKRISDKLLVASGDEQWDDRFGDLPGVDGTVFAIAVSGSEVYVGGDFTTAGSVSANNIAKWNSSTNTWSALGSGVDGTVLAIAASGSEVYVGGLFTEAGGVSASRIAKWNSSTNTWSALGNGVSGPAGANIDVSAIAISGNQVYAGGFFNTAGGVSANKIAKWNSSTNAWSALGSGVQAGFVLSVAVSGSEVYVGGVFTTAGGVNANAIAKWNGSSWSALGSSVSGGDPIVLAIVVSGSEVYAGGGFTDVGGIRVNHIAKWNGSSWSALGRGLSGSHAVWALAVGGSEVYVGYDGTTADGNPGENIAKWNGLTNSWSALSRGINGTVRAAAIQGSSVVAGGDFTSTGGEAAGIARWDGSSWSALGEGLNGTVRAIAIQGSNVYAGGEFTTAGGISANRIAKWDGTSWSALGSGVDGLPNARISAIAIKGSEVYAGGIFTAAGGVTANNIAKWDGSSWSALGSANNNGVDGPVNAVAIASNGEVYFGGQFNNAAGVSAKGIAKWNGSSWSALGSGISGSLQIIYSLVVVGDEVYAGGRFTSAGGLNTNNIAKWNVINSTWAAVGAGVGDVLSIVFSLASSGSDLYVGGVFSLAGGIPANNIAKWDGSGWAALGSGVSGGNNPSVLAIATAASDVYVGGGFTTAGGKSSYKFGRWDASVTSVEDDGRVPQSFALYQNYPNPFNPTTTIRYTLPTPQLVTLRVYDVLGREVATLINERQKAGHYSLSLDASRLSNGIYFYRLKAGKFFATKKLMVVK